MGCMEIEIWVDVVCPWCYIGKRRWEAALAEFPHRDEVTVVWRSFELDPDAPAHLNESIVEMLATKYGVSVDQAVAMNDRVSRMSGGRASSATVTKVPSQHAASAILSAHCRNDQVCVSQTLKISPAASG